MKGVLRRIVGYWYFTITADFTTLYTVYTQQEKENPLSYMAVTLIWYNSSQSINQISIAPISTAKPGSVAQWWSLLGQIPVLRLYCMWMTTVTDCMPMPTLMSTLAAVNPTCLAGSIGGRDTIKWRNEATNARKTKGELCYLEEG